MLLALSVAWGGPATTRDALDRLEEILEVRAEDGTLDREAVLPALLVSTRPRYEESQGWFATRAVEVIQRTLGGDGLRMCEACMAPRAFVEDGRLSYSVGDVGLDEIRRLDEQGRADTQPARTAIWLDEHSTGVAIRIVDLATGRVVFAKNVDPYMAETFRTERAYSLAEEYERRARRDSLTQVFVDLAVYPGQHISLDWTDQWGRYNRQLSGFTLSLIDPVIGIGACHHWRTPLFNTLVGAKLIVSLPTAVVDSLSPDGDIELIDPPLTLVGMARVPFGRSNYGAVLSVSTNGQIGIGVSLLNISLLPVLP